MMSMRQTRYRLYTRGRQLRYTELPEDSEFRISGQFQNNFFFLEIISGEY